MGILEKYLKTNDAEAFKEIYEDIGLALVPEKPYPMLRGIQITLRELVATDPKATRQTEILLKIPITSTLGRNS